MRSSLCVLLQDQTNKHFLLVNRLAVPRLTTFSKSLCREGYFVYVFVLDIFETPVTVTPQQEISKTLHSFKNTYTFTFGERAFTFGERAFTFGDNRGFRGFWNFFFCCWGVLGLRGSGGPVGGFRKYLMFVSPVRNDPSNTQTDFGHPPSPGAIPQICLFFGCGFFAYNWKLPAYSGAFLLTVDKCSLFTCNWSLFAYSFSLLLTVGAFLLTMGKCV